MFSVDLQIAICNSIAMSEAAPTPAAAAPSQAAEPFDPDMAHARRRQAQLSRMIEIGFVLLEGMLEDHAQRHVPAENDSGARKKFEAQYDRITRSIRLTMAMHERGREKMLDLSEGRAAAKKKWEAEHAEKAAAAPKQKHDQAVERVRDIVQDAAEREIEHWSDLDDRLDALEERLDDDEAYADLEHRPLREVVERLCEDLQLSPDWTQWTGQGWTPRPPFYRPPSSAFHAPSRLSVEERYRLKIAAEADERTAERTLE